MGISSECLVSRLAALGCVQSGRHGRLPAAWICSLRYCAACDRAGVCAAAIRRVSRSACQADKRMCLLSRCGAANGEMAAPSLLLRIRRIPSIRSIALPGSYHLFFGGFAEWAAGRTDGCSSVSTGESMRFSSVQCQSWSFRFHARVLRTASRTRRSDDQGVLHVTFERRVRQSRWAIRVFVPDPRMVCRTRRSGN